MPFDPFTYNLNLNFCELLKMFSSLNKDREKSESWLSKQEFFLRTAHVRNEDGSWTLETTALVQMLDKKEQKGMTFTRDGKRDGQTFYASSKSMQKGTTSYSFERNLPNQNGVQDHGTSNYVFFSGGTFEGIFVSHLDNKVRISNGICIPEKQFTALIADPQELASQTTDLCNKIDLR